MKKNYYLPQDDLGRSLWLGNFSKELPQFAAEVGISPQQVAQVQTDHQVFAEIVAYLNQQKGILESLTALKNQVRDGRQPLGGYPVFSPPPSFPPGAAHNVFGRLRLLVRSIKSSPNYTEAIGRSLKIIGDEPNENVAAWKPILAADYKAGSPEIKWRKGKSQGVKIWVDRGDGSGFRFLAIDTFPNFVDKHPLPPQGQTALWQYQAIYLLKDSEVGEMSDVLEVIVKGRAE